MERMLIGLVLFLTVAVGALGVALFNLDDKVSLSTRRVGGSGSRTVAVEDPGTAAHIEKLEGRIDRLLKEVEGLRRRQRQNSTALARAAARGRGGSKGTDGDTKRVEEDPDSLSRPARDAEGVAVSVADEAWYVAVKDSVDRKRRISGQLANMMRRIDRLGESSTIQSVPQHQRAAVEKVLRRFVTSNDDLLTQYLRKPSAELSALTATQRRDALNEERERVVTLAQQALEPLLGAEDTATVVDRTLKSRRVFRGRRSANGRGR